MARITVEDCLAKIDSQYDLVLLAKERTAQLNSGEASLVPADNDKNTVISLREIGEGKISIKTVEDSAINKLRKSQSKPQELDDLEADQEDDFDKIYKGEISKSGAAILPSKRVRRIPEKIISKPEDVAETSQNDVEKNVEKFKSGIEENAKISASDTEESQDTHKDEITPASVDDKTE
ncbi:MAG: DNA-dir [Pelagibacterales bacterium]|nr:DNA-dir [Pelagibacterales bacterium]